MKKTFIKILTLLTGLFCASLFLSCGDNLIGYSIVLWNIPENHIEDCSVVPVYIRSNINHVYVIGTPDGEKIEVPFWQITEPQSKGKTEKLLKKYNEFGGQYARVKKDGLPCRAEQDNTAKQVYRLRAGEVIKVLEKGKEMTITDRKQEIPGVWYKVLTKNGTEGWCFSLNLSLFTMDKDGNIAGGEEITEDLTREIPFEALIDKAWYPNLFNKALAAKTIDTVILNADYKFLIDTENNKVTLGFPPLKDRDQEAITLSWDYTGYTAQGTKQYVLNDIPITLIVKRDNFVVVHYIDNSGKPLDLDFALIDESELTNTIAREKNKRYANFKKVYKNGPYVSESYGKLEINSNYTFTWTGFGRLVGSVIGKNAKTTGTITTKYAIDRKHATSYDGVLSFKFNGQKDEVLFLYKYEEDGLTLEDASGATIKDGVITAPGMSPTVIFFGKKFDYVDLDQEFIDLDDEDLF